MGIFAPQEMMNLADGERLMRAIKAELEGLSKIDS